MGNALLHDKLEKCQKHLAESDLMEHSEKPLIVDKNAKVMQKVSHISVKIAWQRNHTSHLDFTKSSF